MTSTNPIIAKGSLILVTGANGNSLFSTIMYCSSLICARSGFIASHVVEAFLAAGYIVRGTARSASKLTDLQAIWDKRYGRGKFQAAIVEDMAKDGAFDEAVKGAFVHSFLW